MISASWFRLMARNSGTAVKMHQLAEIIQHVTGWRTSLFDVMKAGERGVSMARAFNYLYGFSADDDTLPPRFFEPMRAGTLQGHFIDLQAFEQGKRLYYGMLGWDDGGLPTQAKLEELSVGWIWPRLEAERLSHKIYAI